MHEQSIHFFLSHFRLFLKITNPFVLYYGPRQTERFLRITYTRHDRYSRVLFYCYFNKNKNSTIREFLSFPKMFFSLNHGMYKNEKTFIFSVPTYSC